MQLRIDALESELESTRRGALSGAATGTHTPIGGQSAPLPLNIRLEGGLPPKHAPMEAFQGGLA